MQKGGNRRSTGMQARSSREMLALTVVVFIAMASMASMVSMTSASLLQRGAMVSMASASLLQRRSTSSSLEGQALPLVPHRLIFTKKPENLRHYYANTMDTIAAYEAVWGSTADAVYLTDDDCREKIADVSEQLKLNFDSEEDSDYRADICRVAYLYSVGGYCFGAGMQVIQGEPVFVAAPGISFVAVESSVRFLDGEIGRTQQLQARVAELNSSLLDDRALADRALFHGFLASAPKSPILAQAVRAMEEAPTGQGRSLGRAALIRAVHSIPKAERDKVILLEEIQAGRELYHLA